MQPHQLRALVAVDEHGGISAAARALDLSQPAVTRALRQLEREVQATLLVRSAAGTVLTMSGEALAAHARRILAEERAAREHVAQLVGQRAGRLAVAASAVAMALVVPPAVALMRRAYPAVHLHLLEAVYPTVMEMFRQSAIDLAVGPLPADGPGEGLKAERIFDVGLVVAVRRGHPMRAARSLAALRGLDWIVAGPRAGPGAVHADTFTAAGLAPPRCVMTCDSVTHALGMLAHSDAASFVPAPMARAAREAGQVEIVPVRESPAPLRIHLFRPEGAILTPAGQALYSAIRSVSRSMDR